MEWFQVVLLVITQIWISTATEILYVSPDNSTNDSCSSQPCATLSQYLFDNGTLPVVSNVEYHFLSGEHHVPANMILQNLYNFSIIGTVNNSASPVVLVGCSQSYVINILDSFNVTIKNVMLKQCHQPQYKYAEMTNLLLELCDSCTAENITFINLGLIGKNLMGSTYFTNIIIKVDTDTLQFLVHCQGITLLYSKQQYKSHLIINQITINSNECYNNNPIGMEIIILEVENLIIIINNSLFYELDHTALSINSKYYSNNIIIIENCTFNLNFLAIYNSVYYQITPKSLIDILLSHGNKSIIFKNCNFERNQINGHLISIFVQTSKKFYIRRTNICVDPLTNISFMGCQFNDNVGELMKINGNLCRPNLFIIGHSYFCR